MPLTRGWQPRIVPGIAYDMALPSYSPHAARALPLARAALEGHADALYAGRGGRSSSVYDAAHASVQKGVMADARDPMGRGAHVVDDYWERLLTVAPGMAAAWAADARMRAHHDAHDEL